MSSGGGVVLPKPGYRWDNRAEAVRNRLLQDADRQNLKRGQDIEMGDARLILRSPDGTRWKITVSDAGVVGATSL